MAWKRGTKLIFSEEGLASFHDMKGAKAIFIERAKMTREGNVPWMGLIYVMHNHHKELWSKDYWVRR